MSDAKRSSLGRARGLGSARSGTGHWWAMKLSSIVLLLLAPFFMAGFVHLSTMPFDAARVWLAHPVRGLALLAYLLVSLWHSYLGLRVVIEDYVHCPKVKLFSLLSLKIVHGALMLIAAYSVIVLAAKF